MKERLYADHDRSLAAGVSLLGLAEPGTAEVSEHALVAVLHCRATPPPCAIARSEALFEARLLQNTVGGVTGLDLAVNREIAGSDRATPDFVIAVAVANEPAPGSSGVKSDTASASSAGCHFTLAGDEIERNFAGWGCGFVQLEQLGDHPLELGVHLLDGGRISCKISSVRTHPISSVEDHLISSDRTHLIS